MKSSRPAKYLAKDKKFWNRIAQKYDSQSTKYKEAYNSNIRLTIENTCANCSLLEIGCGTGIITNEVAPHVASIHATDISEKMIEIAIEKANITGNDNITFSVADGYNLDFNGQKFDAILLFNILHLISEPNIFLTELKKHLKPDGKILLAVDCFNEGKTRKDKNIRFFYKAISALRIIPRIYFHSRESIKMLMKKHGFKPVKEEILHVSPVNYFLIAEQN